MICADCRAIVDRYKSRESVNEQGEGILLAMKLIQVSSNLPGFAQVMSALEVGDHQLLYTRYFYMHPACAAELAILGECESWQTGKYLISNVGR